MHHSLDDVFMGAELLQKHNLTECPLQGEGILSAGSTVS